MGRGWRFATNSASHPDKYIDTWFKASHCGVPFLNTPMLVFVPCSWSNTVYSSVSRFTSTIGGFISRYFAMSSSASCSPCAWGREPRALAGTTSTTTARFGGNGGSLLCWQWCFLLLYRRFLLQRSGGNSNSTLALAAGFLAITSGGNDTTRQQDQTGNQETHGILPVVRSKHHTGLWCLS